MWEFTVVIAWKSIEQDNYFDHALNAIEAYLHIDSSNGS